MAYDIEYIRSQFPALQRKVNNFPVVYFDGPGGTQVPQKVVDAMSKYLIHHNANTHGEFAASVETDHMIRQARNAFADFFNCSDDEIAFSENSTTISIKLSQALARDLTPGDEILITDIDHDANRSPWMILSERGIVVQSVAMNKATLTLDMDDLRKKLSPRTKIVAFNCASNAVGTISPAKEIVQLAKQVGAVTVADAVHYALHGVIDVRDIGVDFLFCSAYKFFGPHIGVLYARREAMERLKTLKVSAQDDDPPFKFETGTLNHEGIAGAAEAIEFIADMGKRHEKDFAGQFPTITGRRRDIVCGMTAAEHHEQPMAEYFKTELKKVRGLTLYAPPDNIPCTSTISFTLKGVHPERISTSLGEKGIFVWAGSFYAVQIMRVLGLHERGMLRIGLAPYNTQEEIERTLNEIQSIAKNI